MRRVLATDFGIWFALGDLPQLSTKMVNSKENWSRLAHYLLLYDEIVVPVGNFQILHVLNRMLGVDIVQELIQQNIISFIRFDHWISYRRHGKGIQLFSLHNQPTVPPHFGYSFFRPIDESIEMALHTNTVPGSGQVPWQLKNKIIDNTVITPAQELIKEFADESYNDILGSSYLKSLILLEEAQSLKDLKGIAANQLQVCDPYRNATQANPAIELSHDHRVISLYKSATQANPAIEAVLQVAFENFILCLAGRASVDEVTGDDSALSVVRAKGQRLGYAIEGVNAFVEIEDTYGMPDLGTLFAAGELSPFEILQIRNTKECEQLRQWFSAGPEKESIEEIVARYKESLKIKSWVDRAPSLVLRAAVTTAIGAAIGAATGPLGSVMASAADSYFTSKWFTKKTPRIFLQKTERFIRNRDKRTVGRKQKRRF